MTEAPAELAREWRNRLGAAGSLDLHELVSAGDPTMDDLLAVYKPLDFSLEPLAGSSVVAVDDGLRVGLTARLIPPAWVSGDPVGVIERSFDTTGGWALHHKFEIPHAWAGAGRGRLVTRESALLYERLGIRHVTLDAVDYGRYVWAMCGFDFRLPDERDYVLGAVAEFAEDLGLTLENLDAVEHPWDIGSIIGERPVTMRDIASARGEEIEETADDADLLDREILPGKALLLFSAYEGYQGILRLGDSDDPAGHDQLLIYTDI